MSIGTHQGGCQCGAVRYTVEIDPDAQGITCNCSMCGRSGAVLNFVTPDKFKLEKGKDNLTDYQFNKHVIHHVFCKTCGIKPFAHGKGQQGEMVAINLRCLDDIDTFKIVSAAKQVDGKSR
jgi:hypothetical protein